MSSSDFNIGKIEIHRNAIVGNNGTIVSSQTNHSLSESTINTLIILNTFDKIKNEYGEETANALKCVEEEINKSENKEAVENFESFSEELLKAEPKKSLLKTLWKGTSDALPTIVQLTGVVSTIVKLFT
jgi:GTP-binding protein EngB required for normal cell division